jgi:hypothetical protein
MHLESNLGATFDLGPETITKWEKGGETIMKLADIVRVRSFTLGGGGVMELATADGRKLLVVSSREIGRGSPRLKEPARGEYRAFAAELHRRLAATGNAKFVRGLIFKKAYDPAAIPEAVLP